MDFVLVISYYIPLKGHSNFTCRSNLAVGTFSPEKLFKKLKFHYLNNYFAQVISSFLFEVTHFKKNCSVTCNGRSIVSVYIYQAERPWKRMASFYSLCSKCVSFKFPKFLEVQY